MEQGSSPPRPDRPRRLVMCALSPAILGFALNLAAQTFVFRCVAPGGDVEFRQRPCNEGSDGQEVTIEDRKTGWIPPKVQTGRKEKDDTKGRKLNAGGRGDSAKVRREEQCWKKRQLLEEVNWKLRRGYRAGKGVELRRKRRTCEEYIARYCE